MLTIMMEIFSIKNSTKETKKSQNFSNLTKISRWSIIRFLRQNLEGEKDLNFFKYYSHFITFLGPLSLSHTITMPCRWVWENC